MEIIKSMNDIAVLKTNVVSIWGLQISVIDSKVDMIYEILNQEERKKADHYYDRLKRNTSILARGALRILMSTHLKCKPSDLLFYKNQSGKPYLKDVPFSFNVAHSQDWIIIAIGLDNNLGVDLEAIRSSINIQKAAKRYFSSEEQKILSTCENPRRLFFDLWAHKEALIKARGDRLLTSIKSINIPIVNESIPMGCSIDKWNFYSIEAGSKYAAAVAVDKKIDHFPCYDFGALEWEN